MPSEAARRIIDQAICATENYFGAVSPKRDGHVRSYAREIDALVKAERDENCRAVCPDCAAGYAIGHDGRHVLDDPLTGIPAQWCDVHRSIFDSKSAAQEYAREVANA